MDLTNSLGGDVGGLLQSMIDARKNAPTPEQRQGALETYTAAMRENPDTRQPWEVMLAGRLTAADPFDASQAARASFNHLAQWDETQRESGRLRKMMAAKQEYDDTVARQKEAMTLGGGAGTLPALIRAQTAMAPKARGFEFRKNADGTTTAFDKNTGAPSGTYGPQDIVKISQLTQVLAKAAFEKGEYATLDEALNWAQNEAVSRIGQMNASQGNRTEPLQGNVGGLPRTSPVGATPGIAPAEVHAPQSTDEAEATPQRINLDPEVLLGYPQETQKQIAALVSRMNANPRAIPADLPRLESLLGAQQEQGVQQPGAPMQRKDIPKSKMEESQASELGKTLNAEYDALHTASGGASELKNQLRLLKNIYATPNMPEGQLAEKIQSIKSSMKSLGIDVGPAVGAGDMAEAISGKMALLTRTEGGKNLMPGAMTDFEQKILRGLVPGLNQTAEGRAAMIDYMSDMADMRIRLAHEASKMAAANKNLLPPEWYSRRDRLLKEEQARMVLKSRELANRFKVK